MTTVGGVTRTVARAASGKPVDVYRPGGGPSKPLPVVLLWHGIGPDERDVMRPLAETVARHGLVTIVPDWRSDAPDGGRSDLLNSVDFTLRHGASYGGDTGRTVLVGWSAGAPAACGLAFRPDVVDGWQPAAVVGLAGRYDVPARTTGSVPEAASGEAPAVWLVHGDRDPVIGVSCSRDFASTLRKAGVPAQFETLPTDHAGVIMSEYDPEADRCRPTTDADTLRQGHRVAELIARAAKVTPQGAG